MPRSLDIVVPVHNEEACIDEFLARMDRLRYLDALIIVDNASTDGTVARLAPHAGVRVIRHATNEGYGASIRHGIASSDGELVIVIDADLEYPPEAIPALVDALGKHPVVYASRFIGPRPPAMTPVRRLGNRLVTGIFNLLFRQHATDLYTGMKGLRRDALPLDTLRRDGFEHGVELGVMISLAGHQIFDVPVDYTPRSRGASKMRHVPETVKLLGHMAAYWFRCVVLRRPPGRRRRPAVMPET